MRQCNHDVRRAIESAQLKYWEVADEYGVTDGNFSRLMRRELSPAIKDKIFQAIANLKK